MEVLRGRDGRDGRDGGKGEVGSPGAQGERGVAGPHGPFGEKGMHGNQGLRGGQGEPGLQGPPAGGLAGAVPPAPLTRELHSSTLEELEGLIGSRKEEEQTICVFQMILTISSTRVECKAAAMLVG